MSSRTRFSPPPPRAKGEQPTTPKSAWSQQPNDVSWGARPGELWGVATGPSQRRRGDKARARRRAKRAAKLKNVPLKAYLRQQAQAAAKEEKEKKKS